MSPTRPLVDLAIYLLENDPAGWKTTFTDTGGAQGWRHQTGLYISFGVCETPWWHPRPQEQRVSRLNNDLFVTRREGLRLYRALLKSVAVKIKNDYIQSALKALEAQNKEEAA